MDQRIDSGMLDKILYDIDSLASGIGCENELRKKFVVRKKIKKKQYLLQEGDVCRYIAFVDKGMLRSYFLDKNERERIIQFAVEGNSIVDFHSFNNVVPSYYNIDALEDSELLLIEKSSWDELLNQIPQLEKSLRTSMEKELDKLRSRLHSMLRESVTDRYDLFCQSNPNLISRLPQHMIASYLGVTPSFLSRMLGRRR